MADSQVPWGVVDVAGVALTQPQPLDGGEHLLQGGVGVGHDAGGEEQAVDALLALERDKRVGKLVFTLRRTERAVQRSPARSCAVISTARCAMVRHTLENHAPPQENLSRP